VYTGKANARTFTRTRVLLKAAEGWTDEELCEAFDISRNTSIRVRQVYLEGDWKLCCMTSGNNAVAKRWPVGRLPIW